MHKTFELKLDFWSAPFRKVPGRRISFWMGAVISVIVTGTMVWAASSRVDLEIESIQTQPSRVTRETAVVAVASIRNNGSEMVSNFLVSASLYRGGERIKTIQDIPVLSNLPRAGAGLSVPVQLGKLSEGEYRIVVIVDPRNAIPEEDETNNEQAQNFRVWSPDFRSQTYG